MIRQTLSRGTPGTRAKGQTGAKEGETEAERGRGITCGGYRRVPTAMFTVKASTHTAATTRLSVGTSHWTRTFLFSPTLSFLRTLPSHHTRRSPFFPPTFRHQLSFRAFLVVVATLKIELPTVPRGNRQLLLRSAPQASETDWTYTHGASGRGNICAFAWDNGMSYLLCLHRIYRMQRCSDMSP